MKFSLCLLVLIFDAWSQECGFDLTYWELSDDKCSLLKDTSDLEVKLSIIRTGTLTALGNLNSLMTDLEPLSCGGSQYSFLHPILKPFDPIPGQHFPQPNSADHVFLQGETSQCTPLPVCHGYLVSSQIGHPTSTIYLRAKTWASADQNLFVFLGDESVDASDSEFVSQVPPGKTMSWTIVDSRAGTDLTGGKGLITWTACGHEENEFLAEGHCGGMSLNSGPTVNIKSPVDYVPLSISEDNFDMTIALPTWPQDGDIRTQLKGQCLSYEQVDDIRSFAGATAPIKGGNFVVGNPCEPTPIVATFPDLDSVGKPPYANVYRVCFDVANDRCIFGSAQDDCGLLVHPVPEDLCSGEGIIMPDPSRFKLVCGQQVDPCNHHRMSFLLRNTIALTVTHTPEPFSFFLWPQDIQKEISFFEVQGSSSEDITPIEFNTLILSPDDEVTIRIHWEVVCPVVAVDLDFSMESVEVTESRRWLVGPHWGYDFALYDVGDVSSVKLEALNPSFVGSGMMAINHYAPRDVLYFNFGRLPPTNHNAPVVETVGYESYVIVFKTSILREFPEICNLEVAYTGSVKFRVNGVLKTWVHSTTPSIVSFNDHHFLSNVFTIVEIVYWKHLNLETNVALQWSCDKTKAAVSVPQDNLFSTWSTNSPHYVVPLGYLHSYPPDYLSLLRVSRSTVNLNNHDNNLFFDCLVEPSADVSLNCVSEGSVILFDRCELLFSSSNWVASQQIKIWPSTSEQISSEVTCTATSADSRYNDLQIVIQVQRTPEQPYLCQVGFDFSVSCSGVSASSGDFEIDSHTPEWVVGESITLFLFKTRADADITFHLQVQGQVCSGNKLCIIGAIFQYGDEIFGVYRPKGMKTCRPMCINSKGNTKIKIAVEKGRYVLSTMFGLRVEFNVVYASNGHEFLDVKAYVPAFLRASFETSWCMPLESVPRHNISLWNAGSEKLDNFPTILHKASFDPPDSCSNAEFDSGLTDVVVSSEKVPCTPLVNEPIDIQEEPVQFSVCSVPDYIRSTCSTFMGSPEVLTAIRLCEDSSFLPICPRVYRQSFLSAVSIALRSACDRAQTHLHFKSICERSLNLNPNLCGGRGSVSRTGCQCDAGRFSPACSGFNTITPVPCQHDDCLKCEDRSTLLDSRTGEVWKCFQGYCMYSRNGIVWEGLPSLYGKSAFCLISISWDDNDKRTGRTLWGLTAKMVSVRSIDDGKTWQPHIYNATAKELFQYSLRLNTTNKSPWKKGNSHDRPEDAEQGRQGYFWWITFDELCVHSSHYTRIEKPMIFCSKWWCDCLDVDEWGTTFGVQQIA